MNHAEISIACNPVKSAFFHLAAGLGMGVLVAGTVILVAPRSAQALPKFAAQTGLACGKCHVNPAGGGPRNAFGKAFQANGFKLPKGKKNK